MVINIPTDDLATLGQFESTNGYEMMHKVRSSIEEVLYCFSRSSVKFPGDTGHKIDDFSFGFFTEVTIWCNKLLCFMTKL